MPSGFQFIPSDLSQNVAVCTGMREISGGDDATGVAMLNTSLHDVLGRPYKECSNQTVAECAAVGMARPMGHDRDPCCMHQTDKNSRAMCGDMVRSRMGLKVDPSFPRE